MNHKISEALILAGGIGKRLRPLTYSVPKPLLPIGDKPILEIIINRLKKFNITNIFLSVNYKKELIKSYFNNGSDFGVNIRYLEEEKELGTAGPIFSMCQHTENDFIIMNGDILTEIDFYDFINFHFKRKSIMTIASQKYCIDLDYGIFEINEDKELAKFNEKPKLSFQINAGIYIIKSEIGKLIPKNSFLNMNELWNILKKNNKKISIYNFEQKWVDIGKYEDYIEIQKQVRDIDE